MVSSGRGSHEPMSWLWISFAAFGGVTLVPAVFEAVRSGKIDDWLMVIGLLFWLSLFPVTRLPLPKRMGLPLPLGFFALGYAFVFFSTRDARARAARKRPKNQTPSISWLIGIPIAVLFAIADFWRLPIDLTMAILFTLGTLGSIIWRIVKPSAFA